MSPRRDTYFVFLSLFLCLVSKKVRETQTRYRLAGRTDHISLPLMPDATQRGRAPQSFLLYSMAPSWRLGHAFLILLCSLILIFLFSVENGGGSGKRWDDLMARRKESVLGSLRGSDQCLWLEDWTDAMGKRRKTGRGRAAVNRHVELYIIEDDLYGVLG
ncbi:hypothetical protein B0T10DRAFT_323533 [Thelonectria olida]|uniref:Uncharacterized protein n=1 Tax=Thelonectria olida TaxID=1576542 RepID=A0A9P8W6L2_9HYPO|nr:hypothetical protein B0T10DRAFT_323533 [Thelonectria olida]